MPLTVAERKHLMPFGALKEIAEGQGVDPAYVSKVMADEVRPKTAPKKRQLRRVQVAIARKLGLTVDEAFPQTEQEAAPAAATAS